MLELDIRLDAESTRKPRPTLRRLIERALRDISEKEQQEKSEDIVDAKSKAAVS